MKKTAINTILAPALSTAFLLGTTGCEEVRIEHDASAIKATDVQITFCDPVTHEYEQTDIFRVKDALGCNQKVSEFFSHSSIMHAICYNEGHIVAIIEEQVDGHHKVTLYPKGLFGQGHEQPAPQP